MMTQSMLVRPILESPQRDCRSLESIEPHQHSRLGPDGHTGCLESRRNGADLNLTRFAIRLRDGETPSVESFSTIRLVIFVARGISIVCCKQRSCPLDLESDFIICGGHNPALLVQDMDC